MAVYDVIRLKGNRQKKYFTEIGRKSLDDKDEFYKKEMKRYGIKFSGISGKPVPTVSSGLSQEEVDEIMIKLDDRWKDEEANTKPAMQKSKKVRKALSRSFLTLNTLIMFTKPSQASYSLMRT